MSRVTPLPVPKGADHYISLSPDPNERVELAAAIIQRHMERCQWTRKHIDILSYKEVSVYPQYHKTFINDMPVTLTKKEFDILSLLISDPHRVYEREEILSRVWGKEYEVDYQRLYTSIKRLRNHIRSIDSSLDYIKTVVHVGYCFVI